MPDLDRQVWILACGRLLSQVGIGLLLFYLPVFFVDQMGLSATQVGLGIGSESISGIVGRFLGGSMADSARWGRRRTLMLSALIAALADGGLLLADDFPTFVAANLLMGVGLGLYWPATEAVIADITPAPNRNEAYAVVRVADSIGLGIGVVLRGVLIAATGLYRLPFVVDAVTYLLFFAVVWGAIAESRPAQSEPRAPWHGWGTALGDRNLLIYATVNVLFTSYMAQVHNTLPVVFSQGHTRHGAGLSELVQNLLFTGHVVLTALVQLPIARALNGFRQPRSLMISAVFWGIGFAIVWGAGTGVGSLAFEAGLALTVMAIASVAYIPTASSFVASLAPASMRGVYLSVNSLCWALGYFIGPSVGGWTIDQPQAVTDRVWLGVTLSVLVVIGVLSWLDRRLLSADAAAPETSP